MPETFDNTVAVATSGGVDSSTVAAMLKDEGYELVGLTLQLSLEPPAAERCCGRPWGGAR